MKEKPTFEEPIYETRLEPVYWEHKITDLANRKSICTKVIIKGVTQWYSRGNYINPEATMRNLNGQKP